MDMLAEHDTRAVATTRPMRPIAPTLIRSRPARSVAPAQPGVGDVGFLLQADTGTTTVCLLAWPLVADTWPCLATHWQALRAERDFPRALAPLDAWMMPWAPDLCAPFRDPSSAESTLGAALVRLPVGLAIGIAESPIEAMTRCLDDYVTVAAEQSRKPLAMIITDNETEQALWPQAAMRSWRVDLLRGWHLKVAVNAWRDPAAPLPLQLCRLIAQATARKISEPTRWNPIYDGAEGKMRLLPVALKALQRRGKKA